MKQKFQCLIIMLIHYQLLTITNNRINHSLLGYEPANLTVHPPPQKTIEGGLIFFA